MTWQICSAETTQMGPKLIYTQDKQRNSTVQVCVIAFCHYKTHKSSMHRQCTYVKRQAH